MPYCKITLATSSSQRVRIVRGLAFEKKKKNNKNEKEKHAQGEAEGREIGDDRRRVIKSTGEATERLYLPRSTTEFIPSWDPILARVRRRFLGNNKEIYRRSRGEAPRRIA